MRKVLLGFTLLALACVLIALNEHAVAHALGIDTQASQEYDFFSGSGPVFVALLGYASLFASLLHGFNCHRKGCWRIGRHHIGSGVWCHRHHEEAIPDRTDSDRLEEICALLREIRGRQ